ncbi:Uncharacterised protein [Mycobacteroides abscessus subsp. abscessus]|nr:Uncharacterised protein [Mycobacteroides abscessus subsp. abscessus]
MALDWLPSLPHTVGPMPCSAVSPTTTAPAPSPKMKQLPRSVISSAGESFSEPITSTLLALPPRIMSPATPTAYPNPAQPADRSKAGTPWAPSAVATAGAEAGVCR